MCLCMKWIGEWQIIMLYIYIYIYNNYTSYGANSWWVFVLTSCDNKYHSTKRIDVVILTNIVFYSQDVMDDGHKDELWDQRHTILPNH